MSDWWMGWCRVAWDKTKTRREGGRSDTGGRRSVKSSNACRTHYSIKPTLRGAEVEAHAEYIWWPRLKDGWEGGGGAGVDE